MYKASKDSSIKQLKSDIRLYKKILGKYTGYSKNEVLNCQICFEKLDRNTLLFINDCNHYFCKNCVKSYLHIQFEENSERIICPEKECDNIVSYNLIKENSSRKKFNIYENKLLEICVANSNDMCYCPNEVCSNICVKGSGTNKIKCLSCSYKFCFVCKHKFKSNHVCKTKHNLKKVPREMRKLFKKKNIKLCPQCNMAIEKQTGCNAMKCKSCNTVFCWQCLKTKKTIDKQKNEHNCDSYYNGLYHSDTLSTESSFSYSSYSE
jgi:hypothetical protein